MMQEAEWAGGTNMADGVSKWSAILATWVSVIGAAGGGFMALSTYGEEVAKMEDARVVQTFALFEMFNSAERLASRQHIFDHMGDETLPLANNDLYIFLDFYDALQICVDRNLCDRDLSVRLFQSYAVPVWEGMKDIILASRTASDPNFGAGLKWMASLPVPAPLSATEDPAEPEPQAEPATVAESAPTPAEGAAAPEQ